jgi:hypothetical protein
LVHTMPTSTRANASRCDRAQAAHRFAPRRVIERSRCSFRDRTAASSTVSAAPSPFDLTQQNRKRGMQKVEP